MITVSLVKFWLLILGWLIGVFVTLVVQKKDQFSFWIVTINIIMFGVVITLFYGSK